MEIKISGIPGINICFLKRIFLPVYTAVLSYNFVLLPPDAVAGKAENRLE